MPSNLVSRTFVPLWIIFRYDPVKVHSSRLKIQVGQRAQGMDSMNPTRMTKMISRVRYIKQPLFDSSKDSIMRSTPSHLKTGI
jgi:hypothetical protein